MAEPVQEGLTSFSSLTNGRISSTHWRDMSGVPGPAARKRCWGVPLRCRLRALHKSRNGQVARTVEMEPGAHHQPNPFSVDPHCIGKAYPSHPERILALIPIHTMEQME